MRRWSWLLACIVALAFAQVTPAKGKTGKTTGWTLKSALQAIDKATRELDAVEGEAHYEELFQSRTISGSGKVQASFKGRFRAEVSGSDARTILVTPPYVYIYKPLEQVVETYLTPSHPDLLVQYAVLGFGPTGTALKKQYDVKLLREDTLDDRNVLVFRLSPKSKEAASVISNIVLWIDTASWLPAQQLILHSTSGIQVTVRYLSLTRNDDLPDEFFKPDWPAGTKKTGGQTTLVQD